MKAHGSPPPVLCHTVTSIFDTDENSLSWLLKNYSHTYLLIATQNMFSFWWNMHHPSKDSHKSSKHCMHEKAQISSGKLAGCLQSALTGQSEKIKYFTWGVLVITDSFFVCFWHNIAWLWMHTCRSSVPTRPCCWRVAGCLCVSIFTEHKTTTLCWAPWCIQLCPCSYLDASSW